MPIARRGVGLRGRRGRVGPGGGFFPGAMYGMGGLGYGASNACPPMCMLIVGICLVVLSLVAIVMGALTTAGFFAGGSYIGMSVIGIGVGMIMMGIGFALKGACATYAKRQIQKQGQNRQPGITPGAHPGYAMNVPAAQPGYPLYPANVPAAAHAGYPMNTYPMAYPVNQTPQGEFPRPPDYGWTSQPSDNTAPSKQKSSGGSTGYNKTAAASNNSNNSNGAESRNSNAVNRGRPNSSSSTITVDHA